MGMRQSETMQQAQCGGNDATETAMASQANVRQAGVSYCPDKTIKAGGI
jgi:glutamate dehydrogenase/leucine dehydrogenase